MLQGRQQGRQTLTGQPRNQDRPVVLIQQGRGLLPLHQHIDLVQRSYRGHLGRLQRLQGLHHSMGLRHGIGVRDVHHVQQQIRLGDLFQGGSKGGHQHGRQFLDETHGVGQEHQPAAGELQTACGRIQRGEKLIGDKHLGIRQPVEQRGLAGVGVPHDGNGGHFPPPPAGPMTAPMGAHLLQLFLQLRDAPTNVAPVHLQLSLSRPA